LINILQKSGRKVIYPKIWIIAGVLLGAILLGWSASSYLLFAVVGAMGAAILFRWPFVGLIVLILVALLVPFEIGTGTEVALNATVFLIPAVLGIWVIYMLARRDIQLVRSQSFIPLILFLLAGLLALMIGNILWDPLVPKSSNFFIVQLAQWGIFALSALVYIIAGNLGDEEKKLRYLVFGFMAIAGILSIISMFAGPFRLTDSLTTVALIRAPFWILLAAISGGQLLFNNELSRPWRLLAIISLVAVFVYAFVQQRGAVSNWVGVLVVVAILIWLRWRRLRLPTIFFTALLIFTGILTQTLWDFGGGDTEWTTSGASRIALGERVLRVTMSNPITGLGPAAYRNYAAMEPLQYGRAYWVDPAINSHNNYIDIFSQTGLIGLGLFLWFMVSVLFLAWRLARRYQSGFLGGYVNGMIAAWVAIMVVMMLLDWFLPFVYNVGFPGFQASILVWMFFGGLVAVDNFPRPENSD
jgi:O-antigen ligase